MPHYGTLRDFKFSNEIDDIRGANVYGADNDKLGTLDDVIFDHETGEVKYAVVDTGWLRSRKFLVPADRLHQHREHPHDFTTELLKKHVERFPEYNEETLRSEEKWTDYERRYEESWDQSPIMHREGTDRTITPSPEEMPMPAGADQVTEGRDVTPRRISPPSPPTHPGGTSPQPAEGHPIQPRGSRTTGIPRWDAFASEVRARHPDITKDCPECVSRRRAA